MRLPSSFENSGFRKMNRSRAMAAASVTTANCAPRMRSAGMPTMTPKTVAMRADTRAAGGNGQPASLVSFDRANPAVPARAAVASEIWPT
jgi:hypothetical protein